MRVIKLFLNLILFISGCTFAGGSPNNPASGGSLLDAPTPPPKTCGQPLAEKSAPRYTDVHGVTWQRHILTEARENQRTLLLVVDEPLNADLLPKVVTRKSFGINETGKFVSARAQAFTAPTSNLPALTPSQNPIWPIDRQWTDQDEVDYDAWIHRVARMDFLVGGGVAVDCADYAIALRWIYAHDHHLPVADNLAAGRGLFGSWQSTVEWDKLPTDADWKKDERFKAALRFVLNGTYTHTIFNDLYPVAINLDYVAPGTIFLTLDSDSGHTRTIFSIGVNDQCPDTPDCILIIWGNEPADEGGYITDLLPMKLAANEGGFLRFRWPEKDASGKWQLRAPDQMRGYSVEQYGWSENDYLNIVAARLNLWQTPEAQMTAAGNATTALLLQRLHVVQQGYVVCSLVPCTPKDPIYVDYSTPVRDHAIAQSIQTFQTAYKQVDRSSPVLQDFKNNNSFPIFRGAPFSVFDILSGTLNTQFNSDPSADFFARWGITSLADFQRTSALAEVAHNVWGTREMLISQAQALCFPNNETTAVCDPCDPKIQALATDRLDQGLRLLRQTYLGIYAKLDQASKANADQFLRTYIDMSGYCSSGPNNSCSLAEYFLGPVDHWAAMTSNPDSPRQKRYGF